MYQPAIVVIWMVGVVASLTLVAGRRVVVAVIIVIWVVIIVQEVVAIINVIWVVLEAGEWSSSWSPSR